MDWMALEECPGTTPTPQGQMNGTSSAHEGHIKGGISPGLRTDKGLSTDVREKRKKTATQEEAKQQSRQFSANQARKVELESIPDDDRTTGQTAELKQVRLTLRAIQKKQAAGDFTPWEEAA
jgi:hypothetical protein